MLKFCEKYAILYMEIQNVHKMFIIIFQKLALIKPKL